MPDLSLKFVIQTLDKGGVATFRRIRNEVRGLNQDVKASPGGWSQARTAIDRTTTAAERFNTAGRRGGRTLDELIDRQRRLRRETAQTESVWSRLARTIGMGGGGAGGGGGRGGGMGGAGGAAMASRMAGGVGTVAVAGGAATVGVGFAGVKSSINTGARFESYRASLKTIEGDFAKADRSMAWVQDFAKRTPYELDQVMAAFVQLKAYGMDPMDGTLRSLGDASSAMQKDVLTAVEMMADAQTGEFERLKEFGVRARQQGDQVTFSYTRAGKEMSVTSRKTATEIRRTLLGIFDGSFKGAMDEQSRTWNGMMSNMGDTGTGFLKKIADKGSFDAAKKELSGFLAFLQKAEADGRLDKWASEISDSLVKLITTGAAIAREIDWVQLAKDINTLAEAILALVRAGNQVGELFTPGFWNFNIEKTGGQGPDLLYRAFGRKPGRRTSAAGGLMDFVGNPWAYRPDGEVRARPTVAAPRRTLSEGAGLPGLPGGAPWSAAPAPPQKLSGAISIGLAPGLEIRNADFGPDIDFRRGPAGGGQ
jgi:hypothetical protein